MRRHLGEQVWHEEARHRRRSARFPLGLVLAGTGVALIVLRVAIPQFGWPAFLAGPFELVGVAMVLAGLVLAASAVWKKTRP